MKRKRFMVAVLLLTVNISFLPALDEEAGTDSDTADDFHDEDFDDYLDFGGDAGLTVTASQETTQQMEVITGEDIERRHAPDLATLLEEALDMGITRYGAYGNQTEINIRGFDTERIAILIDGVPANSPRSGEFDINQIDLSNVERIEVIYGGSDTKSNVSGALGGVINIVTVKKQKKGLSVDGSISNTGYLPGGYNKRQSGGDAGEAHAEDIVDTQMLRLSAAYGAENFSWKAAWFGNRAANHYLYRDYSGFARRKEHNEIWDTGANFSLTRNLPRDASLLASAGLYYADKNYPVTGTAQGQAKEYDFSFKPSLMLNMPRAFRDDLSAEASLSYAWADMRYGEVSRSNDHYITGINRWSWYPAQKLTFRSGLDWRFIHVDSTGDGLRNGNNGGLYAAAEYKPFAALLFIASLKGVTDTRQGAAVPKAGFVWQAADWFSLKNNYFRSFKFPDFDDLFYHSADGLYTGNPHLKPEDGWGADLGGEFTFTGGETHGRLKFIPHAPDFSVGSTAYVQWTTDSIHWVKQGAVWSPENIGRGCFIGTDIRPVLAFPLSLGIFDRLKFGFTYQYQLSWLLNDDLDFSDALRIPYMPMHIVGASIDLSWKSGTPAAGSLLLSAHWESIRYADTLNLMELEPYCLVNVTVNQSIGKNLNAFAVLRNALNQLYTSFAEYPMPGISLTLGAQIQITESEN
jgi:vitamin B12 transporter